MTALAANRTDSRSDGRIKAFSQAAGKVWKNGLVSINSAGFLVAASDSATDLAFAGVAYEGYDNTAGTAGGVKTRVWTEGEYTFAFAGGGATQAKVGLPALIVDDQTVQTAATTNNIKCGTIIEYIDANTVRVRIDNKAVG